MYCGPSQMRCWSKRPHACPNPHSFRYYLDEYHIPRYNKRMMSRGPNKASLILICCFHAVAVRVWCKAGRCMHPFCKACLISQIYTGPNPHSFVLVSQPQGAIISEEFVCCCYFFFHIHYFANYNICMVDDDNIYHWIWILFLAKHY